MGLLSLLRASLRQKRIYIRRGGYGRRIGCCSTLHPRAVCGLLGLPYVLLPQVTPDPSQTGSERARTFARDNTITTRRTAHTRVASTAKPLSAFPSRSRRRLSLHRKSRVRFYQPIDRSIISSLSRRSWPKQRIKHQFIISVVWSSIFAVRRRGVYGSTRAIGRWCDADWCSLAN